MRRQARKQRSFAEALARRQPALAPRIVPDPAGAGDVIRPEPDLVMIAAAVAILRPVEDRRRRMADQQVKPAPVGQDRGQVQMGLGGSRGIQEGPGGSERVQEGLEGSRRV